MSSSTRPLRVEIIADDDQFEELRDSWAAVLQDSRDRSVFLTWEWARVWWQHFGESESLHIVTVMDGTRVVAIAPFFRARLGRGRLGASMLAGIGQENADYGGVLLGADPHRTGNVILEHLESEIRHRAVVVNFTRLHPAGDLLPILEHRYGTAGSDVALVREEAVNYPYLDLSIVDDPVAHVAKLEGRNDSRRCLRRLREEHEVVFQYDVEPTSESMQNLFKLYDRRWVDKPGVASGVFSTSRGRRFIQHAGALLHQLGQSRLSFLYADGEPIAGRFGFEFDGAYLGYMETFEPTYAKFGPGQIMVGQVLTTALDRALCEFDFMRGEGSHKSKWANAKREVGYWTLSRGGLLGRMDRKLFWTLMRLRARRSSR